MKVKGLKKLAIAGILATSTVSISGNYNHRCRCNIPISNLLCLGLCFEKATGNKVNYQSIGSGGGIRQNENRTVDFGASDAPLTPEELNKRNYFNSQQ